MTPAPIPADDGDRLRALRALLILDTPAEARFDRIVGFAAAEFHAPMALISLVDQNRQWFKARVGIDACELDRRTSFCGHAILGPDTMVIEDALKDPRFADNPLVLQAPHIRAYVGAPLVLPSGAIVGTLCILDTVPRRFDAMDMAILSSLRDLATEELVQQKAPAP